jgi:hypothetical protein
LRLGLFYYYFFTPLKYIFKGGRKKSDGEYHEACERSEFYHMSDLEKPVALFVPSDDFDTRFFDGSTIPFDPLSDLEPSPPKRSRTATDRGEFNTEIETEDIVQVEFGEFWIAKNSRIKRKKNFELFIKSYYKMPF